MQQHIACIQAALDFTSDKTPKMRQRLHALPTIAVQAVLISVKPSLPCSVFVFAYLAMFCDVLTILPISSLRTSISMLVQVRT